MTNWYRPSAREVARGYIVGTEDSRLPGGDDSLSARDALEQSLCHSLQRGPCVIAFSGGRDSSLLLAAAVHVARREGLPEPVPFTRVFPGIGEADEGHWQEMMIRHLGVIDWERREFGDELDVIGSIAQRHLLSHGLLWPAAIGSSVPLFEMVPGGVVLDGEGGDETLGVDTHRIAPLTDVFMAPRPVRVDRLRPALGALAPARVRLLRARKRWSTDSFEWLRPAVREDFIGELVDDYVNRPLSFASSLRSLLLRRGQIVGMHNRKLLAASYGVDLDSPLMNPTFVGALAREGGWLGRGSRTAVLRQLAGDLLPHAIVERRSKAAFNRAYIGPRSREFADGWQGFGIDEDLVDAELLRAAWLEEQAHWMTALLLQQAWLASQNRKNQTG